MSGSNIERTFASRDSGFPLAGRTGVQGSSLINLLCTPEVISSGLAVLFERTEMKTTIPDELKATVPQTTWGRILTATPVIMTVVATLLAGLASSEMTRAQYDRSFAAQLQSKAGDQWSYFQAKRLRGALQHSTIDVLQSTTPLRPFNAGQFRQFISTQTSSGSADQPEASKARAELLALVDSSDGKATLAVLQKGVLPELPAGEAVEKQVDAALNALDAGRPEVEVSALVAPIKAGTLNETLRADVARAQDFDAALQPFNRTLDQVEGLMSQAGLAPDRDFTVARLRYTALRYEAESRLNQAIANVYELQVRQNNLSAERHHNRSQRFFYGMLAAQAAVIIATFSIAAQRRSFLWLLAAAAGLAAIAFAIYVYFFI